jgi:hypothetical protein
MKEYQSLSHTRWDGKYHDESAISPGRYFGPEATLFRRWDEMSRGSGAYLCPQEQEDERYDPMKLGR